MRVYFSNALLHTLHMSLLFMRSKFRITQFSMGHSYCYELSWNYLRGGWSTYTGRIFLKMDTHSYGIIHISRVHITRHPSSDLNLRFFNLPHFTRGSFKILWYKPLHSFKLVISLGIISNVIYAIFSKELLYNLFWDEGKYKPCLYMRKIVSFEYMVRT